jgi:hypothetical protein
MALDKWDVVAIASEEADKAIQRRNLEEFIEALVQSEMDTKIKKHIDDQLSILRESVKDIHRRLDALLNQGE